MKSLLRTVLAALTLLMASNAVAIGWPSNFEGVMLQGFWWDSYQEDTNWRKLTQRVDELSPYFKLIWVPNSAKSTGGLGYMPVYWFTNHNSSMGNESQLRTMISTYKEKGTGIIADVVINHRAGASNWADFPTETWNGQTWHIGPEGICRDDEWGQGTGNYDTGEKYEAARDLDHTNTNVQNNCKNYCKCLLEDFGYAGFRLDMVKGYGAQYTKIYNQYSQPTYCVGEFWSGYDDIANWIEGTGRTSAAFDFPFKYACNNAFGSGDLTQLCWTDPSGAKKPAGMIHYNYAQYAVTFIDNHDTYRDHNKFGGDVLQANAFMICSPGTPCVFLPHWNQHRAAIQKLIAARNSVGITNTSQVTVLQSARDIYMAEVTGTRGKLVVRIGSSGAKPQGYSDSQIYCSGNGYCVWTTNEGPGPGPDPDPDPVFPSKLYIQGHVNGYDWSTSQGVSATGNNGVYTYKDVTIDASTDGPGFFSFCTQLGSSWDEVNAFDRYGSTTKDEPLQMGSNSAIVRYIGGAGADGCYSWSLAPGTYTIVADLAKMTLSITDGKEDPNPPTPPTPGDLPETLYLQGHVNGYEWATTDAVPAKHTNGVYAYSNITIDDAGEGLGYFAFCTVLGADWDVVNSGDRYGAPEPDTPIAMGQSLPITPYLAGVSAMGCSSWAIAPGKYGILADLVNMTVKVVDPAGLDTIGTDGVAPRYFNLQGIEVARPTQGVYIVVRGNKVSKEYIR